MDPDNHVSRYHRYTRKPRERWLVIGERDGDGLRLTDADGETWLVGSLDEFEAMVTEYRWQVIVGTWSDWPWPVETDWTVNYSLRNNRVSLCYTDPEGHHARYTVTTAALWGLDASPETLRILERFGKDAEVGVLTSPGAVGDATMHRLITRPVDRPSVACQKDLYAHIVGGRVDTPMLGYSAEVAVERDVRGSYVHAAREPLPIGSASHVADGYRPDVEWWEQTFQWYFCQIVFSIPPGLDLAHGVLPVQRGNQTIYPTTTGVYGDGHGGYEEKADVKTRVEFVGDPLHRQRVHKQIEGEEVDVWEPCEIRTLDERPINRLVYDYDREVWATRDEILLAREMGYTILVRRGWGWRQAEQVLAEWANWYWERRQALEASDPELARLYKLMAVAGIGRCLCRPATVVGKPIEECPNGTRIDPNDDVGLVEEPDPDRAVLPHWGIAILAKARCYLYREMIAEEMTGNQVVATNFDAMILVRPSSRPNQPNKLGGWKETILHEVIIPAARSIMSREKIRRPGVSYETRETLPQASARLSGLPAGGGRPPGGLDGASGDRPGAYCADMPDVGANDEGDGGGR